MARANINNSTTRFLNRALGLNKPSGHVPVTKSQMLDGVEKLYGSLSYILPCGHIHTPLPENSWNR